MESRILRILVSLGIPGVALGILYLLFRQFHFEFETIPAVYAAWIAALFMLIVGGIIFYSLARWAPAQSPKGKKKQLEEPRTDPNGGTNEGNLTKRYFEMLSRKCNTLGGLDVGPRLTLERIYIGRELHKKTTQEDPNKVGTVCDDELLMQAGPFILIDGNAGLGKTTLLKSLLLKECQKNSRELGRLPVFISLGILGQQSKAYLKTTTIGRIAIDELSGSGNQQLVAMIDRQVADGQAIVCLDGLDEVPKESRNDMKLWIDSLRNRFMNGQTIVTSRPYSDNISLEGFNLYSIYELNDVLKEKFIYLWFGTIHEQDSETGHAQRLLALLEKNENFSRIIGNPLFLSIICINYEIKKSVARNPAEMMELFVYHLLKEWDRKRGVRRLIGQTGASRMEEIPYYLELKVLTQTAFQLLQRGITMISERKLYYIIRQVIKEEKLALQESRVIDEISQASGIITVQRNGKYQFCHQLFYEFFVANALYSRYWQKNTSKSVKTWIEKEGHNERNANIMAFLNDLFEYRPEERK